VVALLSLPVVAPPPLGDPVETVTLEPVPPDEPADPEKDPVELPDVAGRQHRIANGACGHPELTGSKPGAKVQQDGSGNVTQTPPALTHGSESGPDTAPAPQLYEPVSPLEDPVDALDPVDPAVKPDPPEAPTVRPEPAEVPDEVPPNPPLLGNAVPLDPEAASDLPLVIPPHATCANAVASKTTIAVESGNARAANIDLSGEARCTTGTNPRVVWFQALTYPFGRFVCAKWHESRARMSERSQSANLLLIQSQNKGTAYLESSVWPVLCTTQKTTGYLAGQPLKVTQSVPDGTSMPDGIA
jgi:hypothetical protein